MNDFSNFDGSCLLDQTHTGLAFLEDASLEYVGGGAITNTL